MFAPLAILVLSLSVLLACDTNEAVRAAHEDDIREAVFRHQILQNSNASVYCLTLDYLAEGHHAASFMKRFEAHVPPVNLPSECALDKEKGYRVVQKDTATEGVMLQLSSIKWTKTSEVEVEGGYYRAPLSAEGYTYIVKREGSKWVVKEVKKRFGL